MLYIYIYIIILQRVVNARMQDADLLFYDIV